MAFSRGLLGIRLQRQIAELKSERDALAAQLFNAEQATAAAIERSAAASTPASTPPANLAEIAPALQRLVPSAKSAPGFDQLQSATTPLEVATAIHSLLQTARFAGWREAQAPQEDR